MSNKLTDEQKELLEELKKGKIKVVHDLRDNCWGNRMMMEGNMNNLKITGWKTPIPKTGNRFIGAMQSGKIGLYEFTKIEKVGDPNDMFFGEAKPLMYVEENQVEVK